MSKNFLKKKKESKKKSILVIEDEEMLASMYKDKFEHEGFAVFSAYDGEEGLKMVFKKKPDIVLLDILLPKKEGVDVLKEIRESGKWGKELPIVMFSNLDSSDYILEAISSYNPSYYFMKTNTDLNDVVKRIKELVSF